MQSGGATGFASRGIIPRCVGYVFKQLEAMRAREGARVTARVSYLEIYNEQLYDLLGQDDTTSADLAAFEDKHGVTRVRGLALRPAATEEDALALLFEGDTNRALAEHQLNKASTRSHWYDIVVTLWWCSHVKVPVVG